MTSQIAGFEWISMHKSCCTLYLYIYIPIHLIYFHRNTGALVSASLVIGWSRESREWRKPSEPCNLQYTDAIEQARGAVLTLISIERLSWSILHGLLALRINSPGEEMRFLLHFRIYCSVKTRYMLSHSHMTWYCLFNTRQAHTHTHTHSHTQHAANLVLYLWRPSVEIQPFPHCYHLFYQFYNSNSVIKSHNILPGRL